MRIGIDSRVLVEKGGLKKYAFNLLKYLARIDKENEYVLFFKDIPADFKTPANFKAAAGFFYNDRNNLLWEQLYLPLEIRKLKLDLFHNTYNWGLPFLKTARYVLSLNDIIPFYYPKLYYNYPGYLSVQKNIYLSSFRADFILTLSDFSLRNIMTELKVPEKKIRRIYLGHGKEYKVIDNKTSLELFKEKYRLNFPYLLNTGKFDPRKNIVRLLKAFNRVRNSYKGEIKLVFSGEPTNMRQYNFYYNIPKLIEESGLQDAVVFLGFVEEEELPLLYNGAEALVYPSLYEGFGLPVLEAMACGTPVITSNTTSLPEVAGEAAILIDPENISELAQAMLTVLQDDKVKRELRNRGLVQSQRFSWEKTAQETLAVYRDIV